MNGSAVSEAVAAARGYETLHDSPENRARLKELGIPAFAWQDASAWPGLLVPMYGVTPEADSVQWKPARPQPDAKGKSPKYVSPRSGTNRIDVPAFTRDRLADLNVPLWVTEGIKKVDSLVSRERAAVGITGVFNWKSSMGTSGLWEDVPLKGRKVIICFDADALSKDGVRQAMIRFGAWLKDAKRATPVYLIVPGDVDGRAVKGVDDYFAAGGTVDGLKEAASDTPPKKDLDARFQDAYLAADVAAEVFDGRFIWTPGAGWLRWTGRVWDTATEGDAREAVRQYAVAQFEATAPGMHTNSDRAEAEGWFKTLSISRLTAVTSLARDIVKVDDRALDADRDLLNTPSGVVDLTTGKLSDPDPSLLMTRITGVGYEPDAASADWDRVLAALPEDARDWMQIRAGQAATGHRPDDDIVPVLQGSGANAKTTAMAGLSGALGSYYVLVPDELLTGNAQRDESMMLRGARFALIEETPQGAKLNATMLKKATSTEMTGHHLYQSKTTWQTTHSLFVTTNYKPVVYETDGGTWRRLALVRFPYRYVTGEADHERGERQGDPTLRPRIENGDPAILRAALRWIVDGAVRWYGADRVLPEMPGTVARDTGSWRKETDLVLRYWDERLVPADGHCVIASDLFDDFNTWVSGKGNRETSERVFTGKFEPHEETVRNRVTRRERMKPPKRDLTLSRPEPDPFDVMEGKRSELRPVPGRFTGWVGVRFHTPKDDADDTAEGPEENTAPTSGNAERGTPGYPSNQTPLREGSIGSLVHGVPRGTPNGNAPGQPIAARCRDPFCDAVRTGTHDLCKARAAEAEDGS
ncbi:phage/plasmid primase, P4 family [Streptomyces sp. NPDC001978]|uniref:phage/plasmid primase, P4 family n=1 Tax=Streptomyces sp. NPDC001978 TaxID=3364627 RepID=UPI00368E043C